MYVIVKFFNFSVFLSWGVWESLVLRVVSFNMISKREYLTVVDDLDKLMPWSYYYLFTTCVIVGTKDRMETPLLRVR